MRTKKILLTTLKTVPFVLLVVIILSNLYFGVRQSITREPVVKLCGVSMMYVLSGSMEPTLMPGDMIIIAEHDNYAVGDIVTYLRGSTPFTHRIIAEEGNVYTLKGDNNNTVDEAVSRESIEGKLALRVPKLGNVVIFFKKPLGMLVGLLLLICIMFCDTWYKNLRTYTKERKERRGNR